MRNEEKAAQKRIEGLRSDDTARRPRSHRTSTQRASKQQRPLLTADNLSRASQSDAGGARRARRSSHQGESLRSHSRPPRTQVYQTPYMEESFSRPDLARRHTDHPLSNSLARRSSVGHLGMPVRSFSSPDLESEIDMNLAYGELPDSAKPPRGEREAELKGLMSKLDNLMMEAQCVQHSATTIINSLQANPEAMAAVALTLAEISNLVTKMSPGIISALKAGSPAIFALLVSPQFLIAGGVAVGVTIVMFGGYKIIKKIQANNAARKEGKMDEALAFEGELSSIETWRRGVEVDAGSVGTSVDGELITPAADRIRREELRESSRHGAASVARKPVASKSGDKSDDVETVVSGVTDSTVKPKKKKKEKDGKRSKKTEEAKAKKPNALTLFFKKQEEGRASKKGERHHKKPMLIEL